MWNRNTRLNPALTLFSAFIAVASQAQSPQSSPSIAASVNGSRQVQVVRGNPLLVSAVIQHSRQYAADAALLDVSHGDAGWTSAVRLAVVDSQGQPVTWMIQVTPSTEPTLHLDGSEIGIVSWRIAPEDTTNIATGVYQLTAMLDNTDVPVDGWQGSVASVAVSITINDPPATLSLLDDADQAQLFASYYLLAGDLAKALAALDDLFTRQPDQISALTLRGNILESQGNDADALAAYEHSVSAFQAQFPNAPEPPRVLLRQRALLRTRLQIP